MPLVDNKVHYCAEITGAMKITNETIGRILAKVGWPVMTESRIGGEF